MAWYFGTVLRRSSSPGEGLEGGETKFHLGWSLRKNEEAPGLINAFSFNIFSALEDEECISSCCLLVACSYLLIFHSTEPLPSNTSNGNTVNVLLQRWLYENKDENMTWQEKLERANWKSKRDEKL